MWMNFKDVSSLITAFRFYTLHSKIQSSSQLHVGVGGDVGLHPPEDFITAAEDITAHFPRLPAVLAGCLWDLFDGKSSHKERPERRFKEGSHPLHLLHQGSCFWCPPKLASSDVTATARPDHAPHQPKPCPGLDFLAWPAQSSLSCSGPRYLLLTSDPALLAHIPATSSGRPLPLPALLLPSAPISYCRSVGEKGDPSNLVIK